MTKSHTHSKLTIRLPNDVKDWLAKNAEVNAGSMGSEIVRAVRASMSQQAKSSAS